MALILTKSPLSKTIECNFKTGQLGHSLKVLVNLQLELKYLLCAPIPHSNQWIPEIFWVYHNSPFWPTPLVLLLRQRTIAYSSRRKSNYLGPRSIRKIAKRSQIKFGSTTANWSQTNECLGVTLHEVLLSVKQVLLTVCHTDLVVSLPNSQCIGHVRAWGRCKNP